MTSDDRDAEDHALDAGELVAKLGVQHFASGIRIAAPTTGPHTVPTPPNSVTISACAEVSMPNTVGGVTISSTTRVEPAGDRRDRARHHDGVHLPAERVDARRPRPRARSA